MDGRDEELEQEEQWLGEPLQSITYDHLVNLRGWLLRNAAIMLAIRTRSAHSFASTLNGEMAQDAMDLAITLLEGADPYLWMEERPLFQAIDREISKRQGFQVCRVIERT